MTDSSAALRRLCEDKLGAPAARILARSVDPASANLPLFSLSAAMGSFFLRCEDAEGRSADLAAGPDALADPLLRPMARAVVECGVAALRMRRSGFDMEAGTALLRAWVLIDAFLHRPGILFSVGWVSALPFQIPLLLAAVLFCRHADAMGGDSPVHVVFLLSAASAHERLEIRLSEEA